MYKVIKVAKKSRNGFLVGGKTTRIFFVWRYTKSRYEKKATFGIEETFCG